MKIELNYKEPGTQISAYMYTETFDAETEQDEAVEAYNAVKDRGYEITSFRFVAD